MTGIDWVAVIVFGAAFICGGYEIARTVFSGWDDDDLC